MNKILYLSIVIIICLSSCKSSKSTTSNINKAYYVLDGVPISKKKLEKEIDPKSIVNVSVLKGEAAKTLYSKKGKNGVVIITTKGKATQFYQKLFSSISIDYSKKIKILRDDSQLLYVVDGKPLFKKKESSLIKIKKQSVKKITLLNSKETFDKYGIESKEGAVIINTK